MANGKRVTLEALKTTVEMSAVQRSKDTFLSQCSDLLKNVSEGDLAQAQADLKVLAQNESNPQKIEEIFLKWQQQGDNAPKLATLAYVHFIQNPPKNGDGMPSIMAAAVFGDVPNDKDYHNNDHFRRVATMGLLLTDKKSQAQTNVFRAACIHDYGHDGHGNGDIQCKLEHEAFEETKDILQVAGLGCFAPTDDLRAMLTATDVSGNPSPQEDARRMKAGQRPTGNWNGDVATDIKRLSDNKDLREQAIILREADVLPSSMTPKLSLQGSVDVASEIGIETTPTFNQSFLDNMVGEMQSPKGKKFNSALEKSRKFTRDNSANGKFTGEALKIIEDYERGTPRR